MEDTMRQVMEAAGSVNAKLETLNERAGNISQVVTTITKVADQTALANYDIEQMVKAIQAAVSAGVMSMDKFSENVRPGGGMQTVQEVSGLLSRVIQQVQALAPRFEAVTEGMQTQAIGAEQITEALAQLTDAARQTVESLRLSNLAIDDLNQVSVGLRNGVTGFMTQVA